jgi:hypothetical protein
LDTWFHKKMEFGHILTDDISSLFHCLFILQ